MALLITTTKKRWQKEMIAISKSSPKFTRLILEGATSVINAKHKNEPLEPQKLQKIMESFRIQTFRTCRRSQCSHAMILASDSSEPTSTI